MSKEYKKRTVCKICRTGLSKIKEIGEIEPHNILESLTTNDRINAVTEEDWQTEVKFTAKLCRKVINFKLDIGADEKLGPCVYLRNKKNKQLLKNVSSNSID